MGSYFDRLKSSGYTNSVEGDLGQVIDAKRYVHVGYCTSTPCTTTQKPYKTRTGRAGLKTVQKRKVYITQDRNLDLCPKCGCYLHWERKRWNKVR